MFAAPQAIVPLPETVQTNFVAAQNDTAIIHCPIHPGALLQYYSVRWKKNSVSIAQQSAHGIWQADDRYDIDKSNFSLEITSVNINDSSENYQCEVYVRNPLTDNNYRLQPSREISLTLNVLGMFSLMYILKLNSNNMILHYIIIIIVFTVPPRVLSGPSSVTVISQPSFTCTAMGFPRPTVMWTHSNSSGIEKPLINGEKCQIQSNTTKMDNGVYMIQSMATLLSVTKEDNGIIRCKTGLNGISIAEATLIVH